MIDKKYSGKAIGIDLGTSNSCVAIFESSTTNVLPNGKGDRTTPSILFYKSAKNTPEVGLDAKRQAIIYPEAVIYESKRLIGRSHSVPEDCKIIEEHRKRVKYNIARDGEIPVIKVKPQIGEVFNVKFEEAASKVLIALKKNAEDYLGCEVGAAVITVPSYFGDQQRQATRDAAEIAGLEVLRIINEPTAAALAYYSNNDVEKNVAVYDLGGGTFDISILQLSQGGLIEVKATHGDAFLGGADLDNTVFEYLKKKICESLDPNTIEKLMANPSILQKLRQSAEEAKKSLSYSVETTVAPELGFIDGRPINCEIVMSRDQLEKLTGSIIDRTVSVCKRALEDAKACGINNIDEVILVGGMTRMPLVQRTVGDIFGKQVVIKKDLNPDEIVACGAAIQAGILSDQTDSKTKHILLSDVTPLSMGIETLGGVYTKMVERNTPVPTQASQTYTTAEDNQTEVHIRVFQGERPIAADNRLLGDFVLKGIKPASRGKPQIEVTFSVDVNGMVQVKAVDKETGIEQVIQIQNSTSMDPKEKQRLIREAEENSRRDESRLEISKAISAGESLIYEANSKLKEYGDKIDNNLKEEIDQKVEVLSRPLGELKVKYSNPATDPEGPIRDTLKDVQQKTAELMAAVTKASGYSSSTGENPSDSE